MPSTPFFRWENAAVGMVAALFFSTQARQVTSFTVFGGNAAWKQNSRKVYTQSATTDAASETSKIPIVLLTGFLGTGKTSALQNLLENKDDLRIGVVVNDVASINIDAKLVKRQATDKRQGRKPRQQEKETDTEIVELQNGCACCSLSDELVTSVETLLQSKAASSLESSPPLFDAIVVELSGVADPVAVQNNWQLSTTNRRSSPLLSQQCEISRVVTLIDSSTFGTDYLTWDEASERPGWLDPQSDECTASRKVSELLAEQVEAANLILLNKIDMASPREVKIAGTVAQALNPKASIRQVQFGKISPKQILFGNSDDGTDASNHNHDHSEVEGKPSASSKLDEGNCADPQCTNPDHHHSHSHHDHQAGEDHVHANEGHEHSHTEEHSHGHQHVHVDDLGITSVVYRATVPFNTDRLLKVLGKWPVPIKNTLDLELLQEAQSSGYEIGGKKSTRESPFVGVLRSKGFVWMAPARWASSSRRNPMTPGSSQDDSHRHDTASFWSHAGKHFSITTAGKWWSSIPRQQMKEILRDQPDEYHRIISTEFITEEFGDRRQEIVFIGTGIDEDKITEVLDDCLLTDAEMKSYRQNLEGYVKLMRSASPSSQGLFDLGGTQFVD
jgi:G3E family GTPase